MKKNPWCPGIWGVTLGLLAALAAWPQPASAQLSGDGITIGASIHTDQGTGPFFADIVVGPGAEVPDGSGQLGGYPRAGESVDCDNFQCVFSFSPAGLIGAFELSDLDSLIAQNLVEITITGNLAASSDSHLAIANPEGGSFARFTVDCNPFLAVNPCQGGTVEVNFTFAPAGGGEAGDPLQATIDLIDAVIAQNFPGGTRANLLSKLRGAKRKIEQDKPDDAIQKLNEFNALVAEKQEEGVIGPIGDALVAVAEEIIGQLQAA